MLQEVKEMASKIIDEFYTQNIRILLIYDDDREEDKYIVEWTYSDCKGFAEAFITEEEARKFTSKLLGQE